MRVPVTLLAGAALDAAFGDPPNVAHPVAWFGRLSGLVDRVSPRSRTVGVLAAGALVGGVALTTARGQRVLGRTVTGALALWLATSRRTLLARAAEVAGALDADDLTEARRLLAHHLVSRDTYALDASEVAGATIESVAENLSDGVVAPWCWYVLGGAPAVAAYRALNTLDGMWGYRTPRYAEFGWAAARGDDLANLLPARLTALALVLAAADGAPRAWRTWRRDRGLTDSPNAGHPMAAMAGALGVTLTKRGQYALGARSSEERGAEPTAEDVRRAIALADRAAWIALGALTLVEVCR